MPVLPLRDVVVYPHQVIPLFVGRDKSIQALEQSMEADKTIVLVAQKNATVDDPAAEDYEGIGSLVDPLADELVSSVPIPGGPAARAGLRSGDVVVSR